MKTNIDLLPNLVIAGVAKCGTTSLFSMLGQHPQILASDLKELNYFSPLADGKPLPPLDIYTEHFRQWAGESYRMEASPRYAWLAPEIVAAVARTLPQPRILISLRDPVTRFWSAYGYLRSRGRLARDMSAEAYLEACEHWRSDPSSSPVRGSALTVGMYAEYLPHWFDSFGDDVRVLFAEDLARDPRASVSSLWSWLQLDPSPSTTIDVGSRNTTMQARSHLLARAAELLRPVTRQVFDSRPQLRTSLRQLYGTVNGTARRDQLAPRTADRLRELYEPSNRQLAAFLAARGYQELPDWLTRA